MTNVTLKETQGQRKLKQYVDDLLRNKHFMRLWKKLRDSYKFPADSDKELNQLLNEYKKLDAQARKFEKKLFSEYDRLNTLLAEKYFLDTELLRPVAISDSSLKDGELKQSLLFSEETDLCFLTNNYDYYFDSEFSYPIPFAMDTRKQNHIKVFPLSIDLHRFAAKRDVLDFIEKRWPWIESILGEYREYKNVKFRKRKYDRKLVDFLWHNRHLPAKQLKTELDKQYPHNGLVYYELYKIISLENARRNKEIIVGR